MQNKSQKILIGIIVGLAVLLLLAIGIISFLQQKLKSQSNLLAQNMSDTVSNLVVMKDLADISNDTDLAEINIQSMENLITFVQGRVISVSGNALSIEADIISTEKLTEALNSSELREEYKDNPPLKKKTFSVNITNDTRFTTNKLSEIKAGDSIKVEAEELVYKTDTLTAVSIESPFEL